MRSGNCSISRSYLFYSPSDQTVGPLVYFTFETKGTSLTQRPYWSGGPSKSPITWMNPGWSVFNGERHWQINSLVRRVTKQVRPWSCTVSQKQMAPYKVSDWTNVHFVWQLTTLFRMTLPVSFKARVNSSSTVLFCHLWWHWYTAKKFALNTTRLRPLFTAPDPCTLNQIIMKLNPACRDLGLDESFTTCFAGNDAGVV